MGAFYGSNYHSVNVTFTSKTVSEAVSDWGAGVAKGLIGNVGAAIGNAFAFGPQVAVSKFAQAAMWTVAKETINATVYVSEEFRKADGHDFTVNVTNKWTGPNPILMTASNRDLPSDFRNAIWQEDDTGNSIMRLPDGKRVVYKADCIIDMYGTSRSEYMEGCNASRGTFYGGGGNDIIKDNGGNSRLYGGSGTDRLYGGAGNDYISAGGGDDIMFGGSGADTFVFSKMGGTVMDFQKEDRVVGFDEDQMTVWRHSAGDVVKLSITWQDKTINIVEDGGADGVWWSRDQIIDYLN